MTRVISETVTELRVTNDGKMVLGRSVCFCDRMGLLAHWGYIGIHRRLGKLVCDNLICVFN